MSRLVQARVIDKFADNADDDDNDDDDDDVNVHNDNVRFTESAIQTLDFF